MQRMKKESAPLDDESLFEVKSASRKDIQSWRRRRSALVGSSLDDPSISDPEMKWFQALEGTVLLNLDCPHRTACLRPVNASENI